MKFDKKLYGKIKNMNISQKQVAEMAGLSESSISRYLKGSRKPSAEDLEKIAKALNMNVEEFYDKDKDYDFNDVYAKLEKSLSKMSMKQKLKVLKVLSDSMNKSSDEAAELNE